MLQNRRHLPLSSNSMSSIDANNRKHQVTQV